jgi:hypothetical protein
VGPPLHLTDGGRGADAGVWLDAITPCCGPR